MRLPLHLREGAICTCDLWCAYTRVGSRREVSRKKTGFQVEKVFFTLKVVSFSVGIPMKEFRLRG